MPVIPSRIRFDRYRETVRARNRASKAPASSRGGDHGGELRADGEQSQARKLGHRQRNFFELLVAFWGLLGSQRRSVVAALSVLTVAIFLKLIPPYGTKLAIDSVLTDPPRPLPGLLQ